MKLIPVFHATIKKLRIGGEVKYGVSCAGIKETILCSTPDEANRLSLVGSALVWAFRTFHY